MKVLICQLRNHGDIIRTFPLIDAIKWYYPEAFIAYTCFDEMVDTCKLSKNIDVVIPQPRFKPVTDTQGGTRILDCSEFKAVIELVKKNNFDIYIDLHGVFQSALFGAMANIPIRLGRSEETAKDGAQLFYTDICEIKDKEINRMERHFLISKVILDKIHPVVTQNKNESNIITVFPGSSKKGILKRWSLDNYIKVAEYCLVRNKVRIALGPEEDELIEEIRKLSNIEVVRFYNWEQSKKLIEESRLIIGNDGAYVHLAVWTNIPAIMLCGPLSPNVNGIWKYGKGITVFFKERCNCKFLWQGICNNNHICLDSITIEEVISAIEEL